MSQRGIHISAGRATLVVALLIAIVITFSLPLLRASLLSGWTDAQTQQFFDTNGDGHMSTRELRKGLVTFIMRNAEHDTAFDANGDGTVNRDDVRSIVQFLRSTLAPTCTVQSDVVWSEKTLSPPQTSTIDSFVATKFDRRGDLRRLFVPPGGDAYVFNYLEHMLHVRPDGTSETKETPLSDTDEKVRDAAYAEIFLPSHIEIPHDATSPVQGRFRSTILSQHVPGFHRIVDVSVQAIQAGSSVTTEEIFIVPFTVSQSAPYTVSRGTATALDMGDESPNVRIRMDIDQETGDVYIVVLRVGIQSMAYKFVWNGSMYQKASELAIGYLDPIGMDAVVRFYNGKLYVFAGILHTGSVSQGITEISSGPSGLTLGRSVFVPGGYLLYFGPVSLPHSLLVIVDDAPKPTFTRLDTERFTLTALPNPLEMNEALISDEHDHLVQPFIESQRMFMGTVQETQLPDGRMAILEPLRIRKIMFSNGCSQL